MRETRQGSTTVGVQRWVMAMAVAVVSAAGLMGCSDPLHHGLAEEEANTMMVTLAQEGIEARKVVDPRDGERWAIEVEQSQRVDAWSVLQRHGFPRRAEGGFDDFYPGGGLIPTAEEERVVLQYATSRELQSSLLRIDGVVDAHIHLVLPEQPRIALAGAEISKPRASVLLQWREDEEGPPLSEKALRALISGAVDGLEPEAVRVVMQAVPRPSVEEREMEPAYAQVGPLVVAPESHRMLQAVLAVMGLMVVLMASAVVALVLRFRRVRAGGHHGG